MARVMQVGRSEVLDRLEPADREQIEAVVEVAKAALGEKLVAAALLGSATIGGLRPTSDVDILGVLAEPTTEAERRRIVTRLPEISGSPEPRGRWRPVELTLVVRDDVVPWRYPPMRELQYGEWDRERYLGGFVPVPEADPDLAILLTEARLGHAPLLGPELAAILAPVPFSDVRRAMLDVMPLIGLARSRGLSGQTVSTTHPGAPAVDDEHDVRNDLLTLARIWATLETEAIMSKDIAAEWAASRLGPDLAAPLLAARRQYLEGHHGTTEWRTSMPAARATATAIVQAIEGLA